MAARAGRTRAVHALPAWNERSLRTVYYATVARIIKRLRAIPALAPAGRRTGYVNALTAGLTPLYVARIGDSAERPSQRAPRR
jgi:hypothetical protein